MKVFGSVSTHMVLEFKDLTEVLTYLGRRTSCECIEMHSCLAGVTVWPVFRVRHSSLCVCEQDFPVVVGCQLA